jgi:autotransporter-associated beta strand protein
MNSTVSSRVPSRWSWPQGLLLFLVSPWLPAATASDTVSSGWLTLTPDWRTAYYVRQAPEPGPVVMVVGGVHGNEPAGAAAAEQIRHWSITQGTLIVVPMAAPQAAAAGTRNIPDEGDLNRNFPGLSDSITATSGPTAAALWQFVRQQSPGWLLDLHEGLDFHASNPDSVGSTIIHMNEPVTNLYVARMLSAVNQSITDPAKRFQSIYGPVATGIARASVTHLGTRGMILETTIRGQSLDFRVDQHRTMVNQFLTDNRMLASPFGTQRGGILDDFTFDEPVGTPLPQAGNALPNGATWSVSPFGSQVQQGRFRIQRNHSGTSTTSTGLLGGGTVRVRVPGAADTVATDVHEGFATMVVDGWDFRGSEIGETISYGFRSQVSPEVADTARIVIRRTGLDEVTVSGTGFGTGSGNIAEGIRFAALQEVPVQFVLQLNKEMNLDGSSIVAGASTGGHYRIFFQQPGQDFIQIGDGAAVRRLRDGNHLAMSIAGPIGLEGGFFDIDRLTFGSEFPTALSLAAGQSVFLFAADGTTRSQAQAGYPLLSGTTPIQKTGGGKILLDAANAISGAFSVREGTVVVTAPHALGAATPSVAFGATLTIAADDASAGEVQVTRLGTVEGRIDVGQGRMLVASAQASGGGDLRSLLIAGRNGGTWDGTTGIMSSMAGGSDGRSSFGVGYRLGFDDSATVAWASLGDTDLDGAVTTADVNAMLTSGLFNTGTPGANWQQGDFDYDGFLTTADINALLTTGRLNTGTYAPAASPRSGHTAMSVPEPRSAMLAGLAGLTIASTLRWGQPRRRRFSPIQGFGRLCTALHSCPRRARESITAGACAGGAAALHQAPFRQHGHGQGVIFRVDF